MSLFAAYVPLGFPDLETSFRLVKELDALGADIIEIGVPFSDPIADGETIQGASQNSLEQGTTPLDAFLVPKTRAELYLMTYSNIIHRMGFSKFSSLAISASYSGVIIPDLPPEHQVPMQGLNQVQLVAPNTPIGRAKYLAEVSSGFLYVVSHLSTTGGNSQLDPRLPSLLRELQRSSSIPKLVGFGINSPSVTRRALSMGADGVVVGSALIKRLDKCGLDAAIELAREIIEVLRERSHLFNAV